MYLQKIISKKTLISIVYQLYHLLGIDTDPDRPEPDTNLDPDSTK